VSKARRLRKINERMAAHRSRHGATCSNCGERASHYCPPCLGDPGFFICDRSPLLAVDERDR
jgi:hypothetical protein